MPFHNGISGIYYTQLNSRRDDMTNYVYHYCAEYKTGEKTFRFTGVVAVDNRINSGNYDSFKGVILSDNRHDIPVDKLEIISLTPQYEE